MKKILLAVGVTLCMLLIIPPGSALPREDALAEFEKNLSECLTYDDYEKYAEEIKEKIAKDPHAADIDVLYYGLAKTRLEELGFLANKNDIESVRLYMKVGDAYYAEALTYVDKALRVAKSPRLELDGLFLKFLIYEKKFDTKKKEALFNEIAEKITRFSGDQKKNKRQLDRISYEFKKNALPERAVRIKVLYAEKAPRPSGIEVAEDMKKEAERLFAEEKFKKADTLYKHYFDIARNIFEKDTTAAATLEIADKYFKNRKYAQALGYYRGYLNEYPDLPSADYCAYRAGLCLYFAKNYPAAVRQLNGFLSEYPESKWFDKAFETLSRLFYQNPSREKAIE
ncbi:MAG: outer membrane protein assembly factor BamD, partial [Candidatus Omnitrophota bacterium]